MGVAGDVMTHYENDATLQNLVFGLFFAISLKGGEAGKHTVAEYRNYIEYMMLLHEEDKQLQTRGQSIRDRIKLHTSVPAKSIPNTGGAQSKASRGCQSAMKTGGSCVVQ